MYSLQLSVNEHSETFNLHNPTDLSRNFPLYIEAGMEVTNLDVTGGAPTGNFDKCYFEKVNQLLMERYNCTVLHVYPSNGSFPLCGEETAEEAKFLIIGKNLFWSKQF